jgi:hypothetical protein
MGADTSQHGFGGDYGPRIFQMNQNKFHRSKNNLKNSWFHFGPVDLFPERESAPKLLQFGGRGAVLADLVAWARKKAQSP